MSEPVVMFKCAKCLRKVLTFHMVSGGRIICRPCDDDRRRFIEKHERAKRVGIDAS